MVAPSGAVLCSVVRGQVGEIVDSMGSLDSHFDSDRVDVTCPSCTARYSVPSRKRGKRSRCKGCHTHFLILSDRDLDRHARGEEHVEVACPFCSRHYRAKRRKLGRSMHCKTCTRIFRLIPIGATDLVDPAADQLQIHDDLMSDRDSAQETRLGNSFYEHAEPATKQDSGRPLESYASPEDTALGAGGDSGVEIFRLEMDDSEPSTVEQDADEAGTKESTFDAQPPSHEQDPAANTASPSNLESTESDESVQPATNVQSGVEPVLPEDSAPASLELPQPITGEEDAADVDLASPHQVERHTHLDSDSADHHATTEATKSSADPEALTTDQEEASDVPVTASVDQGDDPIPTSEQPVSEEISDPDHPSDEDALPASISHDVEVTDYDSADNLETSMRVVASEDVPAAWSPTVHFNGQVEPVTAIAITPNGKLLAAGDASGELRLWDIDSQQLLQSRQVMDGPIWALKFYDNQFLYIAGDRGALSCRNLFTSDYDTIWLEAHPAGLTAIDTTSVDGVPLILTTGKDRVPQLWSLATQKVIRRFRGHNDRVSAAALSPDGETAVTASWDGSLRVWSTQTGMPGYTLQRRDRKWLTLAVDWNSHIAWAGAQDGTVCRWHWEGDDAADELKPLDQPVVSIALDPDTAQGKVLCFGSGRGVAALNQAGVLAAQQLADLPSPVSQVVRRGKVEFYTAGYQTIVNGYGL